MNTLPLAKDNRQIPIVPVRLVHPQAVADAGTRTRLVNAQVLPRVFRDCGRRGLHLFVNAKQFREQERKAWADYNASGPNSTRNEWLPVWWAPLHRLEQMPGYGPWVFHSGRNIDASYHYALALTSKPAKGAPLTRPNSKRM